MPLKQQLLYSVRTGINTSRQGLITHIRAVAKDPDKFIKLFSEKKAPAHEIAKVRKMAKNPKKFVMEVDSISDSHLAILDELEKWSDEKFEAAWNNYLLLAGAGIFAFLKEMYDLDNKPKHE